MIRAGEPADAARLATIHIASWQAAYAGLLSAEYLDSLSSGLEARTERWRSVLEQAGGDAVLVAEDDDGTVIGFAHGGPGRDSDVGVAGSGELYSMYLDPAVYRQGIGTRLHEEFLAAMWPQGYPFLTLWVMRDNRTARAFYEGAGWRADGAVTEQCHGIPVPAVRYRIERSRKAS